MYTIVRPAQKLAPNRFILKQNRASAGKSNHNGVARLSNLTLAATTLLEFHCCPTALWSADRTECLFSSAAVALFGFRDSDFRADPKLWIARIDDRDRDAFMSSWQSLRSGESKIVCRYRFSPQNASAAVEIEETALLLSYGATDNRAVLSRYQANRAALRKPDGQGAPVEYLIHQIGNHLQGIRGETDLLRLFNGLPQRSFDTITHSIDRIQNLIAQIEGATEPSTFERPEPAQSAPAAGAKRQ